jgi:hypothetical protein
LRERIVVFQTTLGTSFRETPDKPIDTFAKSIQKLILMFFFLDEKEPKNQERTPTPIFFGTHSAKTPEKIVVRTVRSLPRAI